MKKLLLGLGSLAAVIAPVAAVVACGADSTTPTKTAAETGATVNTKDAALSFKSSSVEEINNAIANAIAADVNAALAKDPTAGSHLTLKNAKDWNVQVKYVKSGFEKIQKNKAGDIIHQRFSPVAKEGYKAISSPVLSYSDATMGTTMNEIPLDVNSFEEYFTKIVKGDGSLGYTGDETGYVHTLAMLVKLAS